MPVRAASNDLHTAPLIGRDDVIAAVKPLFSHRHTRLVTITGPAGVGKSRVATELLAIHGKLPGLAGVIVDLTAVADPGDLDAELARAAGISSVGEGSLRDAVNSWLTGRTALILLDNAEHLPGIGPRLVEWLAIAPDLRVIVTSRKSLNLSMENELELHPLGTNPTAATTTISPAATLFAAIAGCDDPARLTADIRSLLERIVARLDGLPLTIELTAAQLPALDAEHLDTLLRSLDAMARALPAVASALDLAVTRSEALLTPQARALLRHLTVFTGGFTFELVERLVEHAPALDIANRSVADLMDELTANHLVLLHRDQRDVPRFTILTMVAEAIDRLDESHLDRDTVRAAHASAVLDFASAREYAGIWPGHEHEGAEIVTNMHNILAAISWLHERGRRDDLVELIGALTWSWYSQGHYAHGLHQFERVLALDPERTGRSWARFSLGYGVLLDITGRFEQGRAAIQDGLAAYAAEGAVDGITLGNITLGFNAFHLGRYDEAQAALECAIDYARAIPERDLGNALEAIALGNIGANAHERGDPGTAEISLRRAIGIHETMRFQWGAARGLCDLAGVLRDTNQRTEALVTYQHALERSEAVGDHRLIAVALAGIGTVLISDGQHRLGAWLFGGVAALRPLSGKPSFLRANEAAWRSASTSARAAVGEEAFELAWNAGGRSALRDLIHTARNAILIGPNPFPPTRQPLTNQERTVLRMILQDQTTGRIAELLGVSDRTVGSHLAAIFRKYGVNSRLELFALASQHRNSGQNT